jgi:hypothetical protein
MKKLGLSLLLVFLSAHAAYAQQVAPAHKPLPPGEGDAIFLYGSAQAFHDIVQVQHCEQIDVQAVSAIDQRLDTAYTQLKARFGEIKLPAHPPMPTQIAGQSCSAATINSYSNHVRQLEQYLSRLGANS